MGDLTQRLQRLSSAEDFLEFFGVAYEAAVVNVNRLHILKRFHQYLRQAGDISGLGDVDLYRRQRELLARAYGDFLHSTARQEKVFKVFQDAGGARHVPLESVRASLPARKAAAPERRCA